MYVTCYPPVAPCFSHTRVLCRSHALGPPWACLAASHCPRGRATRPTEKLETTEGQGPRGASPRPREEGKAAPEERGRAAASAPPVRSGLHATTTSWGKPKGSPASLPSGVDELFHAPLAVPSLLLAREKQLGTHPTNLVGPPILPSFSPSRIEEGLRGQLHIISQVLRQRGELTQLEIREH